MNESQDLEARLRSELAELAAVPRPARDVRPEALPRKRLFVVAAGATILAIVIGVVIVVQRNEGTRIDAGADDVVRLVPAEATAPQLEKSAELIADRLATAGFEADVSVSRDELEVRSNGPLPRSLLAVIARVGRLEFRLLQGSPIPARHAPTQPSEAPPATCRALVDASRRWFYDSDRENCYRLGPSLLPDPAIGSATADHEVAWVVNVEFGDDRFRTLIAEPYVGRQIAIVVDDVVFSTPTVNPGVTGRHVQITGPPFAEFEARGLAAALSPGELLPVEFVVIGGAPDPEPDPTATSEPIAADDGPPYFNQDHWHVALGVNVCGQWLANPPEFETRSVRGNVRAGIHSHGDGLIHLHPFSSDEAGERATLRTFLEFGGWIDGDGLSLWAPTGACGPAVDPVIQYFVDGVFVDRGLDR